MTLSQLKRKTLENMHKLEEYGEAKKGNKYQDMVDSLIEVNLMIIYTIRISRINIAVE